MDRDEPAPKRPAQTDTETDEKSKPASAWGAGGGSEKEGDTSDLLPWDGDKKAGQKSRGGECCDQLACYCHSNCDPDTILSENLYEMEKAGYKATGSDEEGEARFDDVYDSRHSVDAQLYKM